MGEKVMNQEKNQEMVGIMMSLSENIDKLQDIGNTLVLLEDGMNRETLEYDMYTSTVRMVMESVFDYYVKTKEEITKALEIAKQ